MTLRLIYFGMTGRFSVAPLKALLNAGVEVGAVITPAPPNSPAAAPRRLDSPPAADLPLLTFNPEQNIIELARLRHVPVWSVGNLRHAPTLALLGKLQPDLIVVACFPCLFPPQLLALPRYGCLNLHPSLLPAYRGPEPLFWIARNNEPVSGVTLHFLDRGIDSGDIVSQLSFARPEGMTGAELEQRCAQEGAGLLLNAARQLAAGPLPRHPQPDEGGSYYARPRRDDFIIPTSWPAQRAFNFLRGAEAWPLVIDTGDRRFPIRIAKSYAGHQTLDRPYILLGNELWVQFQPGVLRAGV